VITRTWRLASSGSCGSRAEGSGLLRRLAYIAFFIESGLLLIVLPWSSYWERHAFSHVSPLVHAVLVNHFLRGALTGLGILNLCAGIVEMLPSSAPTK
jgi:hypothetical protein